VIVTITKEDAVGNTLALKKYNFLNERQAFFYNLLFLFVICKEKKLNFFVAMHESQRFLIRRMG